MMRTLDDLTLYVYGLLEEPEREAMKTHLESCPGCQKMVSRIEGEHRLFGGALSRGRVDLSGRSGMLEDVLARRPIGGTFSRPTPPERGNGGMPTSWILPFLRVGTGIALAVSVVFLLFSSGERGRQGKREEPSPSLADRATPPRPRSFDSAYVQDAAIGSIAGRDEEGRTVADLGLKMHQVKVEILDGVAKTTVFETFENLTDRRLEGTFTFPLPQDASISRLALEVNGKMEEGTCLERERAREVFESIVRRMKDPALLEWMPGGIFKCRIFPIESHSTKRVIIGYTQSLSFFRGKASYVYPLASEKTRDHPPELLEISVHARSAGDLKKFESPSHAINVQAKDNHEALLTFSSLNLRPKNDFVVTLETVDEEVRILTHKIDGDDGYFALFLTPEGRQVRHPARYVFILDISASVTGPELEVEKSLVRAMMESRISGDHIEILAANIEVTRSGEVDLRAANNFMDGLRPMGGSDLLGALQEAPEGEIIYIGKGMPTYGETDPARIVEAVKSRRIRTIGVGTRANVDLLRKLGGFLQVNSSDDVPRRIREIGQTLGRPVISNLRINGGDAIYEILGIRDVFEGERLVLTGRYRGSQANLVITGKDYHCELAVAFPPKEEANNYLRRLWAREKVSQLLLLGESARQAVTELGVKHQIMTPYTSFLVLENEEMWKQFQLKREVQKEDRVLGGSGKSFTGSGKEALGVPRTGIVGVFAMKRMAGKSRAERVAIAEAFSKFVSEQARPDAPDRIEYLRLEEQVRRAARLEDTTTSALLPSPTPEAVARELEIIRRSVDDIGKNSEGTVRSELERQLFPQTRLSEPLRPSIDDPTGQVGPGFSSQEGERLDSWDIRRITFRLLADKERGTPEEQAEISKRLLESVVGGGGKGDGEGTNRSTFGQSSILPPPVELDGRRSPLAPGDRRDPFRKDLGLPPDFTNGRKGRSTDLPDQDLAERPGQASQVGGLEFTAPLSKDEARILTGVNGIPVLQEIPLTGYLFSKDGIVPTKPSGGVGGIKEDPSPTRFSLVSNGAPQSIDLPRMSESNLLVKHLYHVTNPNFLPAQVSTATVTTNRFINGQPFESGIDNPTLLTRLTLKRLIDAELTRDASGQPLGRVEYDPMTNVFVVRDRKAIIDRIGEMVSTLNQDILAGGTSREREIRRAYREERQKLHELVTIRARNSSLEEILAEVGRQTGWTIMVDPQVNRAGTRVDEFQVEDENAESALRALGAKAGLTLNYRGGRDYLLSRPAKMTLVARDLDIRELVARVGRETGITVDLSPDVRGTVTLDLRNVPGDVLLASALRTLGWVTIKGESGAIRVEQVDLLLKEMDTRVYRITGDGMQTPLGAALSFLLETLLSRDEEGMTTGRVRFLSESGKYIIVDSTDQGCRRVEEAIAYFDVTPGSTKAPPPIATPYPDHILGLFREARSRLSAARDRSGQEAEGVRALMHLAGELERQVSKAGLRMEVVSFRGNPNEILFAIPKGASLRPGLLFSISREGRFVGLIRIDSVLEDLASGFVWRGLAVGPILPGDSATVIWNVRSFLSSLPPEIQRDLASSENVGTIRAKMGLRE